MHSGGQALKQGSWDAPGPAKAAAAKDPGGVAKLPARSLPAANRPYPVTPRRAAA